MIDVKFEGNWLGVKLALSRLAPEIRSAAVWGQRKVSEKLVSTVKKHINRQDLGWTARSARTNSNDPRILVDEADMLNSIAVWKSGDNYNAGIPGNAYNRNGQRIADYAAMNELGGGDLPARPLWSKSFKEMGGKKGVSAIVTTAVFQKALRLKALGFNVTIGKL